MTAWEAIKETPRRIGQAASSRPQLRSVPRPRREPMGPIAFAMLVIGILVAGMVGLLMLNTMLQNQAFEVRSAQRQARELGYRVSDLESQVTRANSPANLGRRAGELGMVPNPNAVFIDLRTGQITGKPTRVTGGEIPSLSTGSAPAVPPLDAKNPAVQPAATPSASPSASASAAPSASASTKASASGSPSAKASASAKPTAAAKPSASTKATASPTASKKASAAPSSKANG